MSNRKYTRGAYVDEESVVLPSGRRLTGEVVTELVEATRKAGRPSLTSPGARSPQISFRVPDDVRALAAERAAVEGVSVSELSRRALEEYLARQ